MRIRQPVAAGRFYPGQKKQLEDEIKAYMHKHAKTGSNARPWALMLPHAGYVFCGDIIAATLAGLELPAKLVILCPNHTGRGQPLGVWPDGAWLTPLGPVQVDEKLASEIIGSDAGFAPDYLSHLGEHSIEVLLPFLQSCVPNLEIVPICVGTANRTVLKKAGTGLAEVLRLPANKNIGLIVSSDMNHYEDEKTTQIKDQLALDCALKADPDCLLATVQKYAISMCGAAPLALALYAAQDLDGARVEQSGHETSGKASGDYAHVVGYAGLRLFSKAS